MSPARDAVDPLHALKALVVKDGVGLGGLPSAQQSLALALAMVWAGLPADAAVTEREIKHALEARRRDWLAARGAAT